MQPTLFELVVESENRCILSESIFRQTLHVRADEVIE